MSIFTPEFLVMILIGGAAIWIVGKIFFGQNSDIGHCLIGALIVELLYVFVKAPYLEFLPFFILFVYLLQFGKFKIVPALITAALYGFARTAMTMVVASVF